MGTRDYDDETVALTRELVERAAPKPQNANVPHRPRLSAEDLDQSLQAFLKRRHPGPLWAFAYDGTMWQRGTAAAETRPGRVFGVRRKFCIVDDEDYGTPDRPGLKLGLESGGSCAGVAYRLGEGNLENALRAEWARMAGGGSFEPAEVRVRSSDEVYWAVTFTANARHPGFAHGLSSSEVAMAIARASGKEGSCAEYLLRTLEMLDRFQLEDMPIARIGDKVARLLVESYLRNSRDQSPPHGIHDAAE